MSNNLFCRAPQGAANRTGFQDQYVKATFDQMRKAIGFSALPGSADGKVQHQWVLNVIADDTIRVVTVYDYKEAPLQPGKAINWHIGGNSAAGVAEELRSRIGR